MSANLRKTFTIQLAILVATCATLCVRSSAQTSDSERPQIVVGGMVINGIPHDWSHEHVVFSNPGTEPDAIKNGTHDHWLEVVNNPRYILQQLRRREPVQGPHAAEVDKLLAAIRAHEAPAGPVDRLEASPTFDMLQNLRESVEEDTLGRVQLYLKDPLHERRVDFPEEINEGKHQLPGAGPGNLPQAQPPLTRIPPPEGLWALGNSSALNGAFSLATTVYPLKYGFSITSASCANDFVVYPTGFYGAATQATMVAYNNIYSGCGGSFHTVYWAYNTGTNFAANLSPTISLDGSQIAFMQYSSSTSPNTHPSSLVLLKWKACTLPCIVGGTGGSLSSPTLPTSVSNAAYRACTAPCMTTIALSGGFLDDLSNPFYDYGSDTLYVGDIHNSVHKFTGVFKGTPAEAGSPWPVALANSGYHAGTPVLDEGTGNLYVSDFYDTLYSVNPATGAWAGVTPGGLVGYGSWDAPLVDNTALAQYFVLSSFLSDPVGHPNGCANLGATCWNAVLEFYPTDPCYPVAGSCGTAVVDQTGRAYATNANTLGVAVNGIYNGAFDRAYFASANEMSPTGHIFVTSNVFGPAHLVRVPITANVMGAATSGPQIGSNPLNSALTSWGALSPLTDFYNANTGVEYLFFSTNDGYGPDKICSTASPNGCIVSYSATFPAAVVAADTLQAQTFSNTAPTGGFIIDNQVPTGTLAGGSQTYFMEIYGGTGITNACSTSGEYPCAVQASQASVH